MNYCAPNKKFDTIVNTCYDNSELIEIAKAYNKFGQNICTQESCVKFKSIDTKLSKKDIYTELQNRFADTPEYTWLKLGFIQNLDKETRDNLLFFTFKPTPIKTKRSLFDTNNINELLQQYQVKFNEIYGENYYRYLGANPADICRLQKFNWNELQNKHKYISIVFNTDKHTKAGQHWVVCFIDNITKTVEYFDSLGRDPNRYIREFLSNFEIDYTFKINKSEFQEKSNLCGLYTVWFTVMKLNKNSFEQIQEVNIRDHHMYKYLETVFRPHDEYIFTTDGKYTHLKKRSKSKRSKKSKTKHSKQKRSKTKR